ncbi:MAG: branched-chain amino acid ABC transporter permease [Paracoccaceae bacterium]
MTDMATDVARKPTDKKARSVRLDIVIGVIFLAAAITAPFVIESRYVIGQLILGLVWASVAVQWNLLFGYAGVFSLAQMALFAIGGYGTAMLAHYLGWNIWSSIGAGAVIAAAFSMLIGLACLRLQGVYVALLTYAIASVIYLLIMSDTACFRMEGTTCRQFTGGATGFARFGDFGMRPLLRGDWIKGNYAIVLAGFVLTMLASWIIIHSPMGLAFKALRDNQSYAIARGINRFHTQLLVFGISAFFTGLTGGLYAAHFQAIGPNMFSLSQLLFVMAIAVVGGVGTFWGPVVGTIVLMIADEAMREVGQFRTLGLGLIIATCVVLLPRGLVGRFSDFFSRKQT